MKLDIRGLIEYHLYLFTIYLYVNKSRLYLTSEEAFNRTMMNRAYFSSYLLSKFYVEVVQLKKIRNPNEFNYSEKIITEHTQVIKFLNNKETRSVSNKLSELKELRKNADYDMITFISDSDCNQAVTLMKDIFRLLTPFILSYNE